MQPHAETIIALATAPGIGAISVIRLSGNDAIEQCHKVFYSRKGARKLSEKKSHTAHFGTIRDGDAIIDEVVVTIFIAPFSFTEKIQLKFRVMVRLLFSNKLLLCLFVMVRVLLNCSRFANSTSSSLKSNSSSINEAN